MSACEKMEKCPFFNGTLANMPSIATTLKTKFCLADREGCARYLVASSGRQVPATLFPNDVDRAKAILAGS